MQDASISHVMGQYNIGPSFPKNVIYCKSSTRSLSFWDYNINMTEIKPNKIRASIFRLLRPLIHILIKQGVPFSVFSEVAREAYVDVADKEFRLPGRKQSLSRMSVLTGINRKDIAKLFERQRLESETREPMSRPSRIVQGWLRDSRFQSANGEPLPLPFESAPNSFCELVRVYGGDVTPRAMLDELIRIGIVIEQGDKIGLCSNAYIALSDVDEKFRIFTNAARDMFNTINHNLDHQPPDTLLQRSVAYSNIPIESLGEIRLRSKAEAELFLLQINRWLCQYDREVNPDVRGSGRVRAGIGLYYFEQQQEPESEK